MERSKIGVLEGGGITDWVLKKSWTNINYLYEQKRLQTVQPGPSFTA